VLICDVNKSFTKFVTDFGPLLVFFVIYYKYDKNLNIALPPFIVATIVALVVVWFLEKKIPFVPLLGGVLITFFGGLTIYFNNPVFIYVKPTIINALFGLALMFGKFFSREPILKKIIGNSIKLNNDGWKILNNRWMYFFFFLAILNELVWRTQSEEFWVNFKVWGLIPITLIFTLFQVQIINKYKEYE
tara:strand:- start:617 stop:1183 length:567 start_codon:yes stop_codon:yes gene_type:complete